MTTAWSCVVDDTPKIWLAIIPWLATVSNIAERHGSEIHVHHVCPLRSDVADLCRELNVKTQRIERFDARSPHSNKIQQCFTRFGDVARVVLTDVDVVFNDSISMRHIRCQVAGKLVDHPNPPVNVLRKIFSAAGLPQSRLERAGHYDHNGKFLEFETFPANYNGGVYIIEKDVIEPLGEAWARWARWLLANIELLERWTIQVDQVSFCLAANELSLNAGSLDYSWNFPYHLNYPQDCLLPKIMHHHGLMDSSYLINSSANTSLQVYIDGINLTIDRFIRGMEQIEE